MLLKYRFYCCALLWPLLLQPLAERNVVTRVAGVDRVFTGDGQPAKSVPIGYPNGVAVDAAGNLYVTDPLQHLVFRVNPDGTLEVIAGNGIAGHSGDGGAATSAAIASTDSPEQYIGLIAEDGLGGIAVGKQGNAYFADGPYPRRISADRTLRTLPPQPLGLAFDAQGNLYFADGDSTHVSHVRKITTSGLISTVAGGGALFPADNLNPLSLDLSGASAVAVDARGFVYVFAPFHGYLVKFSGGFTTLVTSPVFAVFTDNVPARDCYVAGYRPYDNSGIAFDAEGNLYVANGTYGVLRKIDTRGSISVVAGNSLYGFGGNGGPALDANIQNPTHMTQAPDGTIYFLDVGNGQVRAISPSGIISTVLSNANFSQLGALNGIASDSSGNVYVLLLPRLRYIAPDGSIQILVNQLALTVDNGDGGPA